MHELEQLATGGSFTSNKLRAEAIAAARNAALADEAGKALDATLLTYGAAARPVKAQPVRWVKRSPAAPRRSA